MFLILLLEIFARYLFNSPSVWANELTQMLFGAYVVLSGGHLLWRGGHVGVDILYSRLAPRVKALLDVITSILFFAFCVMMVYFGGSLAWESLARLEHSQSAWNPPVYPVKLTIPIGAILLLLQGVAKLIRDILILAGTESLAPAAASHE
ncbi:MAG: TRAP transporter small permease subunit [Desulfobacteraceae bacterium]|nr:MAG: TRAP transporter small permease subunit [Desulfobacteraceae bacterium]